MAGMVFRLASQAACLLMVQGLNLVRITPRVSQITRTESLNQVCASSNRRAGIDAVWVFSFGRSGSTALEEMLSTAPPCNGGDVIEFPEPCHRGDVANFSSCTEEISALMKCDFSQITYLNRSLSEWEPRHKKNMEELKSSCPGRVRVIKTIHMHSLTEELFPILDRHSTAVGINLVRSPEGIYMSTRTHGMLDQVLSSLNPQHVGLNLMSWSWRPTSDPMPEYLTYICTRMVENYGHEHKQMMTLKYEDLMRDPKVAEKVMDFVGLSTGPEMRNFLDTVFPPHTQDQISHGNHADSDEWTPEEKSALNSAVCDKARRLYGYL